jgi:hypothetical protein
MSVPPGDIATAVRACANVYSSTEVGLAGYTRLSGDQLGGQASDYTGAERANTQIWGVLRLRQCSEAVPRIRPTDLAPRSSATWPVLATPDRSCRPA